MYAYIARTAKERLSNIGPLFTIVRVVEHTACGVDVTLQLGEPTVNGSFLFYSQCERGPAPFFHVSAALYSSLEQQSVVDVSIMYNVDSLLTTHVPTYVCNIN